MRKRGDDRAGRIARHCTGRKQQLVLGQSVVTSVREKVSGKEEEKGSRGKGDKGEDIQFVVLLERIPDARRRRLAARGIDNSPLSAALRDVD